MTTIHYSRPAIGVALLEIDNPPMNALGRAPRAALLAALHEADEDKQIRCIVLTGRGRSFCSGDDLKEQAEANKSGSRAHFGEFGRVLDRIETHRLPVIAAVNGHCLGGGLELASVCDIRIASTAASFVCAGVNVGLMASAYRLPRLIGVARAKHMLLTGVPHNAQIAREFGLVTAVHEPDQLMPEAIKLAERIASRAPLSVEAVKRTAALAPDLTPEQFAEVNSRELSVLSRSADHLEALAAFAAKREPKFKRE
ncbi:MAG: enoyl-CoA hydratase/isomerase family protein [Alphaproteobacteria bacterium]|nr:enoyl-CoA hydratase/isomerase family protein [Alphaproteobacteria bacterium]MBL7097812.1 enoyl-CoA hydratase/isomerase family protein [Alphaproteobacteria bacterium]